MPQETRDKSSVLDYGQPPPRQRRRFLPNAAFLLFGLLLIPCGVGSMPSPDEPQDTRVVCFALMIAGAVVMFASLVHAVVAFFGKWRD